MKKFSFLKLAWLADNGLCAWTAFGADKIVPLKVAADGSDINCLSVHETNEWDPSVAHDGRIVWTRWDYVDRHGCTAHMPWMTTVDGRDPRPVRGNYAPRPSRPDMELNVRAIPGSNKFVATAAPHHGQAFGSLIMIDPEVADDDGMAPVKRLTLWLDCNSMFYGVYEKEGGEAQLRGEIARPTLE